MLLLILQNQMCHQKYNLFRVQVVDHLGKRKLLGHLDRLD